MNWIQLHLVLNHFPVIGTLVGTGLLVFGVATRKDDVRRAALGLVAVMALSALPAYFSGSRAEEPAQSLPSVSSADIGDHELAANVSLVGCTLLGLAAIGALVFFRRPKAIPAPWLGGILILALTCSLLLGWTAHRGGEIRHPEIRGAGALSAAGQP